jgi:ABC-2 type transport system permease protein
MSASPTRPAALADVSEMEPTDWNRVSTGSRLRAFLALVRFSFVRMWHIRQMGWVAVGLLVLLGSIVAVVTYGGIGWGLPERYSFRFRTTFYDYQQQLDLLQMVPLSPEAMAIELAVLAPYRAVMADPIFLQDWSFLFFSRWVIFGMYLSFVLPLFTLAFASGAIGAERESRTLIWLLTRPIPRSWVYFAKLLGVLPWSVLAALGGLLVLGLAGGPLGMRAVSIYWPTALLGSVAFSCLFHLFGSLFRRPTVVGLVYLFFFETLVANLPGSLKQLSLNYYVRSLFYHDAVTVVSSAVPANLDVYDPATPTTAITVLLIVSTALTALGMVLFARAEPAEEE